MSKSTASVNSAMKKRRPRYSKNSFAQEGEDMVLAELFHGQNDGFFVDVGAHHPKRFSNTYHFYQRGWRGINIDATPGCMRAFARSRPLDINIEAAVSDRRQMLNFYSFNEPALNTCNDAVAAERDGFAHYKIQKTITIETITLKEILTRHLPANQVIDFLSVDVEGLDLNVLRSNDWNQFSPRIVVAEDTACKTLSDVAGCQIALFLHSRGYRAIAKTFRTIFFEKFHKP